jgi:hypothetical protein
MKFARLSKQAHKEFSPTKTLWKCFNKFQLDLFSEIMGPSPQENPNNQNNPDGRLFKLALN